MLVRWSRATHVCMLAQDARNLECVPALSGSFLPPACRAACLLTTAGGTLGDKMARKLPNNPNGRILTNQLSVLIGLPLSFLLLKGKPPGAAPCSLNSIKPSYCCLLPLLFCLGAINGTTECSAWLPP